ncbi:MAG: glycoside hydrolase family 3 C-terminal domain-containing protein [Gloeobacteraceae cyanobacterium ES-bin-316]|nr:glycoside hydrolase family 3 C-terminal domain-containing protein [Ferruginibacter sp.]
MSYNASKILKVIVLLFLPSAIFAQSKIVPVYKNKAFTTQQRVADLLKRMTVEEKINQLLSHLDADAKNINENLASNARALETLKNGYGIIQPFDIKPERDVAIKNAVQRYLIEKTRLGIPVLFADEALHGAMRDQATIFPQAIAMASSWDTELVRKINNVSAREIRARGSHIVFSPVVDIARDPRWGRTEETFGEDTYLSAMMGIASVDGLQGGKTGKIDGSHVAATVKHFAGHGQSEGGVNQAPIEIGERALRNFHLRPFQLIIKNAAPAAIMPCYNAIDGIPAHANKWLLQTVLKNEWGFKGLVASDWGGIAQLAKKHKIAANEEDAAVLALKAGVDLDQSSGANYKLLKEIVKRDPSVLPFIDQSVARVLTLKFNLGLFEDPYINIEKIKQVNADPQSKQLAFDAACKTMVLLKNQKNILPLSPGKYQSIAVIGPHVKDMVLGAYSGIPTEKQSIFDGIKNRFSTSNITYAQGCYLTTNYPENSLKAWRQDKQDTATVEVNNKLIAEAEMVIKNADIAILVLGEDELLTREHWSSGVERGGDQATLEISAAQQKLYDVALKTGKPIIVYLMNGRPLAINLIQKTANAIIEGWYAGQEGGRALAAILAGDVSPSAKLPITFARSVGQLPLYYNHQPSAQFYNYTFFENKPLYPFGFGLSYTSFAYSDLKISSTEFTKGKKVEVSFNVSNTGKVMGEEIAQLYIQDNVNSTSRPVKELKDFAKVSLSPGETKRVVFQLDEDKLAFWGVNKKFVVEPGVFEVMIGSSSEDIRLRGEVVAK